MLNPRLSLLPFTGTRRYCSPMPRLDGAQALAGGTFNVPANIPGGIKPSARQGRLPNHSLVLNAVPQVPIRIIRAICGSVPSHGT